MVSEDKLLETTWEWFQFHAEQRFTAFYYYLLIIGALAFGYLQCLQGCGQLKLLAPFLSILGIAVSVAFFYLEIRNVELVNIGRFALNKLKFKPALIDNAKNGDVDEDISEKRKALAKAMMTECCIYERVVKHEFWFRFIYIIIFLYSFCSFIYSLIQLQLSEWWIWLLCIILPSALFIFYYYFSPWGRKEILKGYDWKKIINE